MRDHIFMDIRRSRTIIPKTAYYFDISNKTAIISNNSFPRQPLVTDSSWLDVDQDHIRLHKESIDRIYFDCRVLKTEADRSDHFRIYQAAVVYQWGMISTLRVSS